MIASSCGQQLLVNDEPVLEKRPLFSNSLIIMPNNVRFRWFYLQDSSITRGKMFDSRFFSKKIEFASQTNKPSANSNTSEVDVNSDCEIETTNPPNFDSLKMTKSNESKIIERFPNSHHSEDPVYDREIPTSPIDENNNMVNDDISKGNFTITLRIIFLVSRLVQMR